MLIERGLHGMVTRLSGLKELVYNSMYFTLQKGFNFPVNIQKAFQGHTYNTQKENNNKFEHKSHEKL